MEIDIADICVVGGYFVCLLIVGIYSSCRNRGSVSGYFLAGRSMGWLPVGASLFASNIGSGHFVGLAGSGAGSGIGVGIFEVQAVFDLLILGWIFTPVYQSARIFTMPEYIYKRFGGKRMRTYLSILTLILYVTTKISADLYAGSIFINQALKLSLYPSVIILLSISALFSMMGGLTTVIWTDAIQTVIMIIGASYLSIVSFIKLNGHEGILSSFLNSIPSQTHTYVDYHNANQSSDFPSLFLSEVNSGQRVDYSKCGIPREDSLSFFKAASSSELPWTGSVFGLLIQSTWYWCTDQVIVQRVLSAKTFTHAKGGIILASSLKLLPLFLLIFPGMASRALFTDEVACGIPDVCERICGKRQGCTDIAYPKLVLSLLPSGARGLMLSVMLASLVSSLTSIFNSASVIFTMDIWKNFRKKATDVELMIVGRLSVVVLVAISIAWIPIIQSSNQLFDYIQRVTGYLAPPICAVYVMGLFWQRCTEKGAFYGLLFGFACGMTRFISEIYYTGQICGETNYMPEVIGKVHYLNFTIILFSLTMFVIWIISINTDPIHEKHTYKKMFQNRNLPYNPNLDPGIEFEEGGDNVSDQRGSKLDYNYEKVPLYKRIIYWFCGIEDMIKTQNDERKAANYQDQMTSGNMETNIDERESHRLYINIAALTVTSVTVYILSFYN